jgi:hypothetical protein
MMWIRAADELICATDAGREGELIFRYILELTGATAKPARRLWLSSLTEAAIRDAFRALRPLSDYDALYAAARCRSQADWVVGLNATRYYTVRHRDAGGRLWSVGRVQAPVLALTRFSAGVRCALRSSRHARASRRAQRASGRHAAATCSGRCVLRAERFGTNSLRCFGRMLQA